MVAVLRPLLGVVAVCGYSSGRVYPQSVPKARLVPSVCEVDPAQRG